MIPGEIEYARSEAEAFVLRVEAEARPERRARERVNDVADRRRYAAMLAEVARHRGLGQWPDAVAHLLAEAERIDREATVALRAAMAEAGAAVVGGPR